jgi:hypothetical protein
VGVEDDIDEIRRNMEDAESDRENVIANGFVLRIEPQPELDERGAPYEAHGDGMRYVIDATALLHRTIEEKARDGYERLRSIFPVPRASMGSHEPRVPWLSLGRMNGRGTKHPWIAKAKAVEDQPDVWLSSHDPELVVFAKGVLRLR